MNSKSCGRKWLCYVVWAHPVIFIKGLGKSTKIGSQDSWFPGRDLNAGSLEYEIGMLCFQSSHKQNMYLN
jgi:hypothetical protein